MVQYYTQEFETTAEIIINFSYSILKIFERVKMIKTFELFV